MNIFEKVTVKTKEIGKTAKDKTQSTITVFNLNTNISENKKIISDLKMKIGETYYKDRYDASLDSLVDDIHKYEEEIVKLQKQISDIKIREAGGGKICPHCGSIVQENAKFCTSCGKALDDNKGVNE